MIRVAIVDDEPLARRRLRALLAAQPDFELVAECADGPDARVAIQRLRPDVAFMAMELSTAREHELVRTLTPPLPFIVLVTGYDQFTVSAFQAAAIDYLVKPFDQERFAASLRRIRGQLAQGESRQSHERLLSVVQAIVQARDERASAVTNGARERIRVADIEIDPAAREVRRAGVEVTLRPKLFELLLALACRSGEIVSRKELLRAVWGYQGDVFTRTIDAHLVALRRKLGHERHEAGYIETVPRAGYRLITAPEQRP
jgi:DNA-binding response OmpR family regulator